MVLSILFFGGETLHYFALALTIGICFGIYSSVLVMAPLVMWMGVSREDLVKPDKKREGRRRQGHAVMRRRPRVGTGNGVRPSPGRPAARADAGATSAEPDPHFRMLTTIFYSLLALDQTRRPAGRPVRTLAVRAAVPRHLRRNGARRVPVPAGRLDPVHRRHRRGDRRARRARAGGRADRRRHTRRHRQLLGRPLHRAQGLRHGPTRAGSSRRTCAGRRSSTTSTAASRSSSAASCRSSARSRRSSPAWPE